MLLVSVRYGAAYHTQRSPIDSNVYIAHQNWNSVALINDFAVGLDVIVLWRLCTTDQFGCTIGNAAGGEYGAHMLGSGRDPPRFSVRIDFSN